MDIHTTKQEILREAYMGRLGSYGVSFRGKIRSDYLRI